MNPSSRQHHAPRYFQTSFRPSQAKPRSYCCHSSRWHVFQGNRVEEEPWRDLLCGMSEVRDRAPFTQLLFSFFSFPLDLRSSATSKYLVNLVRYVPPIEFPLNLPLTLHIAERLCFFVSKRSVFSSIFRFHVMDTKCTLSMTRQSCHGTGNSVSPSF
jgi:hypothetical protein